MKSLIQKSLLSLASLILVIGCAKEEKIVTYDLKASSFPNSGGTTSQTTGLFDAGTSTTITATASEGYIFSKWSGSNSSSTNPLTITVNSDISVIANFVLSDADSDGVPDINDTCANTPSGEAANTTGCSLSQIDSDNDGIFDDIDECLTPENTEVTETGCPIIVEVVEEEEIIEEVEEVVEEEEEEIIEEVEEVEEVVEEEETEEVEEEEEIEVPVDDDSDGVTNDLDQCSNTSDGETVNAEGCAPSQLDSDDDGVTDDKDQCDNTPIGNSVDDNGCTLASKTYIPDDAFEQRLIQWQVDDVMDNYVLTSALEEMKNFSITLTDANKNSLIQDFTGLEAMVNLETLKIFGYYAFNDSNFPFSSLTRLAKMEFSCADISGLDFSNNLRLDSLIVWGGCTVGDDRMKISGVDFSQNNNLIYAELPYVGGFEANATISTLINIKTLRLYSTDNFQELNTTSSAIGLTENVNLEKIIISGEPLFIDLRNGNNSKLTLVSVSQSTCISVDDIAHVQSLDSFDLYLSLDCYAVEAAKTYVPNGGFEQLLIDMGKDDVLDDYVLTSSVETITELDVPSINFPDITSVVSDFTGIEDFKNLETLRMVGYTDYSTIDFKSLTKLKELSISCGIVDGFDLSNNLELMSFSAYGSNDNTCGMIIRNMDFTANTKLKSFSTGWTGFDDFNALMATMPNLENFSLGSGGAATIDLSNNPKLKTITFNSDLGGPSKVDLRSGGNANLQSINFASILWNPTCLSVDDVAHVQSVLIGESVSVSLDCGF